MKVTHWMLLGVSLVSSVALALPAATMNVSVDRTEIGQDESVSLRFSIRTEGQLDLDGPRFVAPDFDVVNEYNGQFMESYYENGRFGMRNNQTVTKVLRPKRAGTLVISGIEATVNGQKQTSPNLEVTVTAGGAGTPPPRGYGSSPSAGLRGMQKRGPSTGFFLRAEVDKQRVYKGEQVIVSYYLYRRVRTFNISVDKYPVLSGFLREDLEMPVLGPRLDAEPVTVNGTLYQRSLLVRYAAYPLKEGKLPIDQMNIRANYYATTQGDDDEDPMFNFFRQMTPLQGTAQSDPVAIEVLPLPVDRPASFGGGIGDFNIVATVDKNEVRANEAVTLVAKIDGRGNVSGIEEPKGVWPDGVQLFDSKGRARAAKAGYGEKIFEFVLIPRNPGTLVLPALEFSYFDPNKKDYVTKKTDAITINVLDAAPGTVAPPKPVVSQPIPITQSPVKPTEPAILRDLKEIGGLSSGPNLIWLGRILALLGALFAGLIWIKGGRRRSSGSAKPRKGASSPVWNELSEIAGKNEIALNDLTRAYDRLCIAVYDSIDGVYSIGARSLPRSELRRLLVGERGVPESLWGRISKLLEFGETVRFAASAGAVTEVEARSKLKDWIKEGAQIERELGQTS